MLCNVGSIFVITCSCRLVVVVAVVVVSLSICLSASLKTKLFCETSSVFELDNINVKNEAILRDFLIFWSWQHQKTKQFCETSFKNGNLSVELTACTNAFCDFSTPPVWSRGPATKKWCQVIRSAAPVAQNHLSKPTDLMLQNATPLRKSAPGPPNSSDEHVSCTAAAMENASLQILFKCPTRHLNVKKCSKPLSFFHFWLPNVLRATTACTFSTSQLPKVVGTWCAFVHFDFEMCFALKRRLLFRHLNFQKWSEPGVLCTFDFEMCFAPQGRALFRHLNFQKWSEAGVFYILSSKCVSRHNGVQFSSLIWPAGSAPAALASLLFDPPQPQIIGKTQRFATFLPFRAPWSSFFWDFLFFDLLSSSLLFSDSSHLCFSFVHIVGSLTSKLPSIKPYCIII